MRSSSSKILTSLGTIILMVLVHAVSPWSGYTNATEPANHQPEPEAWEKLKPGQSTGEDVVEHLGAPLWKYNVYTAEDYIRLRLPEGRDFIRDHIAWEHRVRLRVLRFRGDEDRESYAAVLRNNVLHYTIGPVPPDERDLESLRQRYGQPEMERVAALPRLRGLVVAWYPRQGLAFIRDAVWDEHFTGKLRMAPTETVPRLLDEAVFGQPQYFDNSGGLDLEFP